MSTIAELKVLTALLTDEEDDDIPLARFIIWANECSDDLAPVARKRVESTVAAWEGGEEFALPADLVEIRQLKYDDEVILPANLNTDYDTVNYSRWGSIIKFSEEMDAAELEISYYRRLTVFTLGTDTPEIPVQYHRLYALWAASRYWKMHGDEIEKEHLLRSEYELLKKELDRYTLREGGPRAFKVRFRW